jgi:Predicted acyltransferases
MSLAPTQLEFASERIASQQSAETVQLRLGYRPWLDGLRGLAILSVMAYHAELLPRGHVGVDLFFVVSGLLITLLLLEERSETGKISFGRFYARRVLRLFPALFVMLCVSLILMLVSPEVGQNYRSVLYSAFYVTNWVVALGLDQVSSTLYITWSLAIEEQFYLLWPMLLALLLSFRNRRRLIVFGLSAALILCCALRVLLHSQGALVVRIGQGSDTRADGLIAGCLLAALISFGRLPSIRTVRICIAVLALPFAAYVLEITEPFGVGLTLINLFFAAVLLLLFVEPPARTLTILQSRVLVWVGKLSYSLYLWHLFARYAAEKWMGKSSIGVTIASTLLAFAMAALSYYVIERPFLKLKKRYSVLA